MKVKMKVPHDPQIVELDTDKRYLFIFSGDQTDFEAVTHLTDALMHDNINAMAFWIQSGNPKDVQVIDLEEIKKQ